MTGLRTAVGIIISVAMIVWFVYLLLWITGAIEEYRRITQKGI